MSTDLTHLQSLAAERLEHIRALSVSTSAVRAEVLRLYALGAQKTSLALVAGVSRPTLDAWLARRI